MSIKKITKHIVLKNIYKETFNKFNKVQTDLAYSG